MQEQSLFEASAHNKIALCCYGVEVRLEFPPIDESSADTQPEELAVDVSSIPDANSQVVDGLL